MCLGIPGRITAISGADFPTGTVDFGGVHREVCLAYVADEVSVGDYVIVHVGYALTKLDPDEAARTLEVFAQAGLAPPVQAT